MIALPALCARHFQELDPGSLFIGEHQYIKSCFIKCFETDSARNYRHLALMLGPDVPHESRAPMLVAYEPDAEILDLGKDFVVEITPNPSHTRFLLPVEDDATYGLVYVGDMLLIRAHHGEETGFHGCYIDIHSGEIFMKPMERGHAMMDSWTIRLRTPGFGAGLSQPVVKYPVD